MLKNPETQNRDGTKRKETLGSVHQRKQGHQTDSGSMHCGASDLQRRTLISFGREEVGDLWLLSITLNTYNACHWKAKKCAQLESWSMCSFRVIANKQQQVFSLRRREGSGERLQQSKLPPHTTPHAAKLTGLWPCICSLQSLCWLLPINQAERGREEEKDRDGFVCDWTAGEKIGFFKPNPALGAGWAGLPVG